MQNTIPVTILTGFLGSGKTTYLNHILSSNSDTRYAIIENEFGEAGIDNELVIKADETIVELNNGCLCCTLNDNLYEILNELFTRRDEFDELIIEATGVADPTGLAQPFISHPLIKKHFPLSAIICLVDAEQIEDHLKQTEEAKQQVTYSDILLINKIDLVSEDRLYQLKSKLEVINPLADIIYRLQFDFPNIELCRHNKLLEEKLDLMDNTDNESTSASGCPVQKPHSHHHHHHTEGINSQTIILDNPLDLRKLNINLSVFLTFQSSGLYRMKGLIWIKGADYQFVLQSAGKRFDISEHRKWSNDEIRQSKIVFIGKKLKKEGFEKMLSHCLAG